VGVFQELNPNGFFPDFILDRTSYFLQVFRILVLGHFAFWDGVGCTLTIFLLIIGSVIDFVRDVVALAETKALYILMYNCIN